MGEVVHEVEELFLDLDADEHQIDFPILYANARDRPGVAGPADARGTDLEPLFETLLARIPAPEYEEGHPLQALVTNLDASPYVGRLALCRVRQRHRSGAASRWRGAASTARSSGSRSPSSTSPRRSTASTPRRPVPGEIIAVAGIAEVTIGETLADPDDPRPLPSSRVDEPSLSMTIGINTSPLSGRTATRSRPAC